MTRTGRDGRVDEPMRKLDSQLPAADVVLVVCVAGGNKRFL